MIEIPIRIQGKNVLTACRIESAHLFTGKNERRWTNCGTSLCGDEFLFGPVAGLAICDWLEEQCVILMGCDDQWNPLWKTCCTNLEAAKDQASFEYDGISGSWQ